MIYKYEECDLFCVPSNYYLVQCISADFAMGAGIAVQFNKHFNVKENEIRQRGCRMGRLLDKGFLCTGRQSVQSGNETELLPQAD